ncbi:hypothetical protein NECAME_03478 [Necator americanus]|uniref:Uncharacterized protein n=1 Tax=Necator americanus TaxID=51031 RepID=W2T2U2_NECAM|nr:hypothetical protein NECAME_03478 [Necator americanus]ETN76315.1 hypothetical protein NECAME_03478 [Necator americanus]
MTITDKTPSQHKFDNTANHVPSEQAKDISTVKQDADSEAIPSREGEGESAPRREAAASVNLRNNLCSNHATTKITLYGGASDGDYKDQFFACLALLKID